ncbi:MAG: NAD-dependent epimerase/dehydratase family protein [Deltaproteobacteria bacterium]|nr:NAD-dependent epimerase/dehydratase family protein [Deltaproteobacteria bacterium]
MTKRLTADQHSVTALILPTELPPSQRNTEYVKADLCDAKTLYGLTRGHDAVIHLAGAVGYGQSWAACQRVNVTGTKNIAEEAIRSGVLRFIHMSSVSVYGRKANCSIDENSPLVKIGDPYGDTKIDAERLLTSLSRRSGIGLTILRPTVIYGPNDDKFLPKVVENLRKKSAGIIGNGKNRLDLIHVDDVIDFLLLSLENPKTINQTYNLTNNSNGNWGDFLNYLSSLIGEPPPTQHIPYPFAYAVASTLEMIAKFTRRPPRITRYAVRVVGKHYNYLTEKAEKELGYQAKRKLKLALKECLP